MVPSTARHHLKGQLRTYEVPTVERVDSHLRELAHRLDAAGPQMIPRIWADINMLLERRAALTATADRRPKETL